MPLTSLNTNYQRKNYFVSYSLCYLIGVYTRLIIVKQMSIAWSDACEETRGDISFVPHDLLLHRYIILYNYFVLKETLR